MVFSSVGQTDEDVVDKSSAIGQNSRDDVINSSLSGQCGAYRCGRLM